MTLISLSPNDVPPDTEPVSDDVPPLRCTEDGCNNSLTYGGRGRRPTKCDEHKGPKGTPRTGKRSTAWAKGDAVEKALTQALSWFGAGVAFVNPDDGKVIAKGGPAVSHELVELARVDKRLRPYLEWIAAPGKYGPLAMALAYVTLPIMANHNLLPQFIIPMIVAEPIKEGGQHE